MAVTRMMINCDNPCFLLIITWIYFILRKSLEIAFSDHKCWRSDKWCTTCTSTRHIAIWIYMNIIYPANRDTWYSNAPVWGRTNHVCPLDGSLIGAGSNKWERADGLDHEKAPWEQFLAPYTVYLTPPRYPSKAKNPIPSQSIHPTYT